MPPQTTEEKITALGNKVGEHASKLTKLEQGVGDISGQLLTIRNDLAWHWKIGAGIVLLFIGAFGWLLSSYIPGKLNDTVPADFKERFGKLEQNVGDMKEQFNRLTPNSLKQLIAPNQTPSALTANLKEASAVVDAALRVQLPSNPALLKPLRQQVGNIVAESSSNKQLHTAAMALAVRLDGYGNASDYLLTGSQPITTPDPNGYLVEKPSFIISGGTIACSRGPVAHFMGWHTPQQAAGIVVVDLHVEKCSQVLSGPQWINVTFDGATLEYNGGPLKLAGVIFKNCTFKFGNDPDSDQALASITASHNEPVSLLIQ